MNITHVYAPIVKSERGADGNLYVYGKMTGPDLDQDGQRMDATWLKTAVPQWFDTGANIRQMHQNIAVGRGSELEQHDDDWWLTAKVVDPAAIKLVDENVLQGFSIGIHAPKLRKDAAAPNGWIVGGTIVETSLVDRPSNTTTKLVLAKVAGAALVDVAQVLAKDVTMDMTGTGVPGDAAIEIDHMAIVREHLALWLAEEAAEVAAGTGGVYVVRQIATLLCDLTWAAQEDAYDDVEAALDAVKVAMFKPLQEETVNLTQMATLVKAASADDAPAAQKTALVELRKNLGVDDLATTIADAVTKATDAQQETKRLSADVAKVMDTVSTSGPTRIRTQPDAVKAAAYDLALNEASRLEELAGTVSDPDLAEGYRTLAIRKRADANLLKAATT